MEPLEADLLLTADPPTGVASMMRSSCSRAFWGAAGGLMARMSFNDWVFGSLVLDLENIAFLALEVLDLDLDLAALVFDFPLFWVFEILALEAPLVLPAALVAFLVPLALYAEGEGFLLTLGVVFFWVVFFLMDFFTLEALGVFLVALVFFLAVVLAVVRFLAAEALVVFLVVLALVADFRVVGISFKPLF